MKVGSLFSGIGGIDLGFIQAGFEIAWANEFDHDACITYRNNIPECELIEKDVRSLDFSNLDDIDILAAGFPCQPFSVMGYQKGFRDKRGSLFFEIVRAIEEKNPSVIFLENVKNLLWHDHGNTFLVIYNALAQHGYTVKYKVIDAKDMNIPQKRARIFIVAFRDLIMCDHFMFPDSIELNKGINDIIDRSVRHDKIYYYSPENCYYNELNRKIQDKEFIYRIDDSGVAMRKYSICPTLKANMGTYHDRIPIIRDDYGIIKLTLTECLAFQGFPSDFLFKNIPLMSAYKQVGNTVCVPVIKSIASNIGKLFI